MLVLGLDDFTMRERCPLCSAPLGQLLATETMFARWEAFPAADVSLSPAVDRIRRVYRCPTCGLWYFNCVPRPGTIQSILDQPALVQRWRGPDRPGFQRTRLALRTYFPAGGSILDIGANNGEFLDTLPKGWDKAALEPMQATAASIKNTKLYVGYLEDVALPESQFDCICAFDVAEHLNDPQIALERLSMGVKLGGLVILETGTSDAKMARLLRGGWYYLNFLEHFQVFNAHSLRFALERLGLSILDVQQVQHRSVPRSIQLRSLTSLGIYCTLTGCGRTAGLWRFINGRVRSSLPGAPPSSLGIDRDHIFIVARKVHE